MNRRGFLAGLLATSAALNLPKMALPVKAAPPIAPEVETGSYLGFTGQNTTIFANPVLETTRIVNMRLVWSGSPQKLTINRFLKIGNKYVRQADLGTFDVVQGANEFTFEKPIIML